MKSLAEAKRRIRVGTKLHVEHYKWPDRTRDVICVEKTGPTNIVTLPLHVIPAAEQTGPIRKEVRSWTPWGKAADVKVEGDSVTFHREGQAWFTYTILEDAPEVRP